MNKLWIKLSFAFILAYIITWVTAISLLFLSNFIFVDSEEETGNPALGEVFDYYYPLQDALYAGNSAEKIEELTTEFEALLNRTIVDLKEEGFAEGQRPENYVEPGIKDILIHVVTPLVLVIFTVSGIVGTIMGLILSRSFTAPLKNLADAAKLIGKKNLHVSVPSKGAREFRELADSFNRMTEELRVSEEREKLFSADIAHELRTPLSVLEGNLRASLDNVRNIDEEYIAKLYSQTGYLIRLVKDLHELSMAESHQLPIIQSDFNLSVLIREIAAIFEPVSEDLDVSLEYDLPGDNLFIHADQSRIRQILHNLIDNAFRHTPPGGKILISASLQDGYVKITVSDNGEGIEEKHLENIFERLYRADSARSRGKGGTGLGLSIVRAIVNNHGGSVHVESEGKGRGAAFIITLPA